MCYRLKMVSYAGFSQTVAEGDLEEMKTRATEIIDEHDGDVSIVIPGMSWELEDPGDRLITDFDGHLFIVSLVNPNDEDTYNDEEEDEDDDD